MRLRAKQEDELVVAAAAPPALEHGLGFGHLRVSGLPSVWILGKTEEKKGKQEIFLSNGLVPDFERKERSPL